MRYTLFLLGLVLGCHPTNRIEKTSLNMFTPPGTMLLAENFYADETEVSNIAYKEFNYWVKRTFGILSDETEAVIPDPDVWKYQSHNDTLGANYFLEAQFDEYPVVGVTYQQAKAYCQWRTDRVAEMILIKNGVIKPYREQGREDYFTLEGYMDGDMGEDVQIINQVFPIYRLPTQKEWIELSGFNHPDYVYGTDSTSQRNQNVLGTYGCLYQTLERLQRVPEGSPNHLPTEHCESMSTNINGLYHIVGNVAEMIDQPGYVIGGSWNHTLTKMPPDSAVRVNLPNCYTGFRCVAEFRKVVPGDGVSLVP